MSLITGESVSLHRGTVLTIRSPGERLDGERGSVEGFKKNKWKVRLLDGDKQVLVPERDLADSQQEVTTLRQRNEALARQVKELERELAALSSLQVSSLSAERTAPLSRTGSKTSSFGHSASREVPTVLQGVRLSWRSSSNSAKQSGGESRCSLQAEFC